MTTVRVSRRILWIGGEAYPLHNIARAQTVKVTPRRAAMAWSFVKATLLWVGLGVAAALALGYAHRSESGDPMVRGIWMAVAALVGLSALKLLAGLATRVRYALVIETAGSPRTALVTRQRHVADQLVHRIMDAIDNPQATFEVQVENLHVGDKIEQFGDHNVGKVAR